MRSARSACVALAVGALLALPGPVQLAGAHAQPQPQPAPGTLVETSNDTRFQLDLYVSDGALAAYLPAGWSSNVASQGPAKDANLRAVFIDRVTVNAPDGKPVGSTGTNRLVYLVAPVNDASGATAQLVVGGITEDPSDAPGPFGNTFWRQRTRCSELPRPLPMARSWTPRIGASQPTRVSISRCT